MSAVLARVACDGVGAVGLSATWGPAHTALPPPLTADMVGGLRYNLRRTTQEGGGT